MVEKLRKFELSNWVQLLLAAVVFFGGIWEQQRVISQKLEDFITLRTVILTKHEEAQTTHERLDDERFRAIESRVKTIEDWRLNLAENRK